MREDASMQLLIWPGVDAVFSTRRVGQVARAVVNKNHTRKVLATELYYLPLLEAGSLRSSRRQFGFFCMSPVDKWMYVPIFLPIIRGFIYLLAMQSYGKIRRHTEGQLKRESEREKERDSMGSLPK